MWHPSFGGQRYNWGRVPNAASGYNRQKPRGVDYLSERWVTRHTARRQPECPACAALPVAPRER